MKGTARDWSTRKVELLATPRYGTEQLPFSAELRALRGRERGSFRIVSYQPIFGNDAFHDMTVDDARWMARLIAQLTEGQMQQALIAAGYTSAEVRLYTVLHGGHTWPGGWQYLSERLVGKTSRDWSASEAIWAFLKDKRLESPTP